MVDFGSDDDSYVSCLVADDYTVQYSVQCSVLYTMRKMYLYLYKRIE